MNRLLGFFSIVLLCHSAYTAQISQGCQDNLQRFADCARPNFPTVVENQVATEAAVHCFVDNGCVDPTCIRDEMKQVLPQALQGCSGIDITKMLGGADSGNGAAFARIAMERSVSDMKDESILRMCNGDQGKQSTVKKLSSRCSAKLSSSASSKCEHGCHGHVRISIGLDCLQG